MSAAKEYTSASKFVVDFKGDGENPDKNWFEIRGGGVILHAITLTNGASKHRETKTGDVEFSEITITGPMCKGRKDALDFVNSWCQPSGNKGERVDGSIKFLNENDEVVRTFNFLGAAPVRYDAPGLDANSDQFLEESLTFKVQYIDEA